MDLQHEGPEGQLARWLEQIQEFDFKVGHRRGSCHLNADALSRLHNLGESESPGKLLEYPAQSCSCAVQDCDQPLTEIRELQGADEDIGPVLQSVISGQVPEASLCKGKSREFNQLVQLWEQLLVKNGVLFRHREDPGSVIQQVCGSEGSQVPGIEASARRCIRWSSGRSKNSGLTT